MSGDGPRHIERASAELIVETHGPFRITRALLEERSRYPLA